MLEKPDLPDAAIAETLSDRYGLAVTALEFLPIGNDATAWAYRVAADDGAAYFLKVRRGEVSLASLRIPRFLREAGVTQVVAPLPARDGALSAPLDGYSLILYPFVAGRVGMDAGLAPAQWTELGAALRRIHAIRLPADLAGQAAREAFVPPWAGMVRRLDAQIAAADGFDDPHRRALAAFWRPRCAAIAAIVAEAEELGRALRSDPPPFVLCHADIHTANVLLDAEGGLRIVDWDGVILAPIERDLMFVLGDGAERSADEAAFFRGYGEAAVNLTALAYYRREWVVQDIGDYGERVFFMPELGDATRADAVAGLAAMFDPGDVVAAALGTTPCC
jgi:spectinomycin phosphotransferase